MTGTGMETEGVIALAVAWMQLWCCLMLFTIFLFSCLYMSLCVFSLSMRLSQAGLCGVAPDWTSFGGQVVRLHQQLVTS